VAVSGLDASIITDELRFLSYRLLWALQWSASQVPASATVAVAVGAMFDAIFLRRSKLRSFANQWVDWSKRWTCTFGTEWRRLCRSPVDTRGGGQAVGAGRAVFEGSGTEVLPPGALAGPTGDLARSPAVAVAAYYSGSGGAVPGLTGVGGDLTGPQSPPASVRALAPMPRPADRAGIG
jgi:hypothetical protein